MKKFFVVCLVVFTAALGFAASEDMGMYEYLYEGTSSHEDQLALLELIAEQKISGAGEFYANALNRLVGAYPNITGATERSYAEDQALLLANLLGQEKHTPAAPDLWRVANSFSTPLARAEALMALGKMRATEFLPQVIKVLQDLNASPTADRLNGERVAFGAIVALEKYQDISGYLPVYFASVGWYQDRIKSQARSSLAVISGDPTQPLTDVIKSSSYNYETKLAALQAIDAADVSSEAKSQAAVAAFTASWGSANTDVRLRGLLNTLRKTSMSMIRANGAADDTVYPLLERSYKQFAERTDGDRDEALDAIVTLRTLATEEAAKRLSAYLMTINAKQQSGSLTRKDEDLVREIIPALGATGQASARQALNVVNAINWTSAVKTLAQNALRELP